MFNRRWLRLIIACSAMIVVFPSVTQATTTTEELPFVYPTALNAAGQTLRGDLNFDGRVDLTDFSVLSTFWHGYPAPPADLVADGRVDVRDLAALLDAWTPAFNAVTTTAFNAVGKPGSGESVRLDFALPAGQTAAGDRSAQAIAQFLLQAGGDGQTSSAKPYELRLVAGNRFTVYLVVSTGDRAVSAANLTVRYSATSAALRRVSVAPSVFPFWIEPPHVTAPGELRLAGGIPKGAKGSMLVIATLEFELLGQLPAVMAMGNDSRMSFADGAGTNVIFQTTPLAVALNATNSAVALNATQPIALNATQPIALNATGSIESPDPQPVSTSHPDQNAWYRDHAISLAWDADNRPGDAYAFYFQPLDGPALPEVYAAATRLEWTAPTDGTWIFSLRRLRQGAGSRPVKYYFHLDSDPPRAFTPQANSFQAGNGNLWMVTFHTDDAVSGLDGYAVDEAGRRQAQQEEGYILRNQSPGAHPVTITARDYAGNERQASVTVRVPPVAAEVCQSPQNVELFYRCWDKNELWVITAEISMGALIVLLHLSGRRLLQARPSKARRRRKELRV